MDSIERGSQTAEFGLAQNVVAGLSNHSSFASDKDQNGYNALVEEMS